MQKILTLIIFLLNSSFIMAQTATVTGIVKDKTTQESLVGANIIIENSQPLIGASSEVDGSFRLSTKPGSYNITASLVGYKPLTKFNILLTSGNINTVTFDLEEENLTLQEVVLEGRKTAEAATIETPLSVQRLTTEEIRSNPGGNFDISRVIQALPGVGGATGSASFRNDIIIRGGAPNENVYYLDGIEIPTINHFSTQGSAGGPQGILNVSFIEDVTLTTSAFEARYNNTLSSVLQFRQREGNPERIQGNFRLSATELATTVDGPLNKKTTFLASARRSYLKFIFQLIDLPIRPDYWDFQYKVTHKFNARTSVSAIGVGAIDRFRFAIPKNSTPENIYVIRSSPIISQDSYTLGVSLKHLIPQGYLNVSLSRNLLNNNIDKFEDSTAPVETERTLKLRSVEAENKLRVDINKAKDEWKYSAGAVVEYVTFKNDAYNVIRREVVDQDGNIVQPEVIYQFNSNLNLLKGGVFFQLSKRINNLSLSAGVRSDVNSFTADGSNLFKTISPRLGVSYNLFEKWNLNASVGRYFKLPAYTTLAFQSNGVFVNESSTYVACDHYVAGIEYLPLENLRFTMEGFYKQYDGYPISVRTGNSIANTGVEFGQVGSEPVYSDGKGRAFGLEWFAQQKLSKNTFFTVSYTLFRSEFTGIDGEYKPSSWDNRHLVSAILGRKLKRNWELGLKFRYAGGSPFTPFDMEASRLNYLTVGEGIPDYSRVNDERLGAFAQMDLRIDKKWNFKRVAVDVFIDIQNATNTPPPGSLRYTFQRNADNTAFETTDGEPVRSDGSNAIPKILKDEDASILPSIGLIVEF